MSEEKEDIVEEPKEVGEVLEDALNEMRGSSDDAREEAPKEPVDQNETGEEAAAAEPESEEEEFDTTALSERAQERFRTLTERAKAAEEAQATARAEADEIVQKNAELYKIMNDSGVTPQDLTAYFEYFRSTKNGNVTGADKYWQELQETHARMTGINPGQDPLDRHEDLKKGVADFDISEDKARELATLRDMQQRMTMAEQRQAEFNAQYEEQNRQQQEAASYAQRASQALDEWSARMQQEDPYFAQKEQILIERAQDSFPNIHPAHWPEYIAKEYEFISRAFDARAKNEPVKPVSPNPIRPGVTSKGAAPEPSSVEEALTFALREMRE